MPKIISDLRAHLQANSLKFVSVTFLLVCFLSLKESFCETRKNVFILLQKLLPLLRKSKFWIFKFYEFIKCLSIKQEIILLNNLGSKHSLLMKFGLFMSNYKRKMFTKKFYINCDLKTSSRLFCVCKELSTDSIRKLNF